MFWIQRGFVWSWRELHAHHPPSPAFIGHEVVLCPWGTFLENCPAQVSSAPQPAPLLDQLHISQHVGVAQGQHHVLNMLMFHEDHSYWWHYLLHGPASFHGVCGVFYFPRFCWRRTHVPSSLNCLRHHHWMPIDCLPSSVQIWLYFLVPGILYHRNSSFLWVNFYITSVSPWCGGQTYAMANGKWRAHISPSLLTPPLLPTDFILPIYGEWQEILKQMYFTFTFADNHLFNDISCFVLSLLSFLAYGRPELGNNTPGCSNVKHTQRYYRGERCRCYT